MAIGSGSPWRIYASFSGKNADIIKNVQGSLLSGQIENRGASKQYLQLFDRIDQPLTNDVPLLVFPLYAGGGYVLDKNFWGVEGLAFQKGIAYGISSTVATFTAGTTDCTVQFMYW